METNGNGIESIGAGIAERSYLGAHTQAAEHCSPSITRLAVALAKAQAGFTVIERTREVTVKPKESPSYTFRYAPLDVVLAATLPALNANGLSLVSLPIMGGDRLRTLLLHESGEFIAVEVLMPEFQGPQKFGSALTYMRRYSIISLLGVASEEDDDGNAAEGNHIEKKTDRPPAAQPPKERPWMKRLQAAVTKLNLGEKQADAKRATGKMRDDIIRDYRLLYLGWCTGRQDVKSTLDLTDEEAAKVIAKAEAGEIPS